MRTFRPLLIPTIPCSVAIAFFVFAVPSAADAEQPPYLDYCERLSQEIQGRKHAFLAGNRTYYVGGIHHCWKLHEQETIGLTHPFFHDLRGRGFGLAKHDGSGYGHDFRGWEFYAQSRVAYGSVLLDGKPYPTPQPTSMVWRPDKVICKYLVGGVRIVEEKFIAENDAICTIIKSERPIQLHFTGRSLYIPGQSLESTASANFDTSNNAVHVSEGGTVTTHPVRDESHPGKLIYDGMSTVLSSSRPIEKFATNANEEGQHEYSFVIPCDPEGTALVWGMSDRYQDALADVQQVSSDHRAALVAKTKAMNDLLNLQVPYFRCSDEEMVDVYYYLWAIYLMYYIDVQQGWETHPHTQSAVNNFLGMHRYDANFQIKVGAWTADKPYYAYGNVLHWKPLLPYARDNGRLPDNKGIGWFSPVWGTTTEHVIGAWQIYQHTGDEAFVHDCYDDYFRELFKDGLDGHWGCHYDAAEHLRQMALITGDGDPDRWPELVNLKGREHWLNSMWEKNHPRFFGGRREHPEWSGFAYLRNSYFPTDWAREMTREWAVNSERGFFWDVPLSSRTVPRLSEVFDPEFSSTPDTNYYALIGMYKSGVGRDANRCALMHLKKYNTHWGIPIAPEAWGAGPSPWGDQYSNFNAGKILLFLEGMAGIEYSVPDSTLTVRDTMPEQWDSMEVRFPVDIEGTRHWPCVAYRRKKTERGVAKAIVVEESPFQQADIRVWLEEGQLLRTTDGYVEDDGRGRYAKYHFNSSPNVKAMVEIGR